MINKKVKGENIVVKEVPVVGLLTVGVGIDQGTYIAVWFAKVVQVCQGSRSRPRLHKGHT